MSSEMSVLNLKIWLIR